MKENIKRALKWLFFVVLLAALPYLEPLLISGLTALFPSLEDHLVVTYPEEILAIRDRLAAVTFDGLYLSFAVQWGKVMVAGLLTEAFWLLSIGLIGYYFFTRFIPFLIIQGLDAFLLCVSGFLGLLAWISCVFWLASCILPFDFPLATVYLPSYDTVKGVGADITHFMELWLKIEVSYFGHVNKLFQWIVQLELLLLPLGMKFLFGCSMLIAFMMADDDEASWRAVWTR